MTAAQPTPPVERPTEPADAQQHLTSHLHCISCQYDLHGQPRSGQCPECGWDVGTTLRALELNHAWLLTIRNGLRWLLVSMYLIAFLVATRYFDTMDSIVIALMHFSAAMCLITPNPNRPTDRTANRWPPMLIAVSIGLYLISSSDWITGSALAWILDSIGAAVQACGLAALWWRVQAVLDQGIAPKSAVIARNLAGLTIIVGVLTLLPPLLFQFSSGSAWSTAIASGTRLLWLLALLVWFFSSVITLHLTGVPLRKLIALTEAS